MLAIRSLAMTKTLLLILLLAPFSSVRAANLSVQSSGPFQGNAPPPISTASSIKKVAVAGATGNTGQTVIRKLSASGFEVTALTRSSTSAQSLSRPDVNAVEVDYLSNQSLLSALRGIDAVVVCGVGMYA